MTARRRSIKRNKKGGFLNRFDSIADNTKVKTFCCKNKENVGGLQLGTTQTNKGEECDPSHSGQCYPNQYKFRCYDTKTTIDENGNEIVAYKDEINEGDGEKCKYVAGVVGKIGSTLGNFTKGVGQSGNAIVNFAVSNGGKKSKRRKSNKNRRTIKRK